MNDDDRFWAKVAKSSGCWLWTGTKAGSGYGRFWADGQRIYAHRWAYSRFVAPIPDGYEIDHLCREPACVNPTHLEPVSHRENSLRGDSPIARNARKTHCIRGHPLIGDNLRAGRYRQCRTCARDRARSRMR